MTIWLYGGPYDGLVIDGVEPTGSWVGVSDNANPRQLPSRYKPLGYSVGGLGGGFVHQAAERLYASYRVQGEMTRPQEAIAESALMIELERLATEKNLKLLTATAYFSRLDGDDHAIVVGEAYGESSPAEVKATMSRVVG